MFIIFIRSVILYALVVVSVRLMGKRQIGQLQPSELVITILVSNIATLALEDVDTPLVIGATAIFTLVSLDVIMSWVTLKSLSIRRLVSGRPRIVVSNGEVNQRELQRLRFSFDDLMEGLRSNGVFDICEVQLAIVETTGAISVYQKFPYRNVTHDDMQIKGSLENPPVILINDGVVQHDALRDNSLGMDWVDSILKKNNIELRNVFLLSAYKNGQHQLILKDSKR